MSDNLDIFMERLLKKEPGEPDEITREVMKEVEEIVAREKDSCDGYLEHSEDNDDIVNIFEPMQTEDIPETSEDIVHVHNVPMQISPHYEHSEDNDDIVNIVEPMQTEDIPETSETTVPMQSEDIAETSDNIPETSKDSVCINIPMDSNGRMQSYTTLSQNTRSLSNLFSSQHVNNPGSASSSSANTLLPKGASESSSVEQRKPKNKQGNKLVKRLKKYQIAGPLKDKKEERKRKAACNARKHREKQEKQMNDLKQVLDVCNAEKENLKEENKKLKLENERIRQKIAEIKFLLQN